MVNGEMIVIMYHGFVAEMNDFTVTQRVNGYKLLIDKLLPFILGFTIE